MAITLIFRLVVPYFRSVAELNLPDDLRMPYLDYKRHSWRNGLNEEQHLNLPSSLRFG